MNILVVVLAQLLLLFHAPRAQRNIQFPVFVFGAYHKPDLAGRIGRNSSIRVLDVREDLQTGFLQVTNELQV